MANANIIVATVNVRGLRNVNKRNTLFHYLKEKKYDIICLQETYCTEEIKEQLNNDWNGPSFHSVSQSSHSKGVSILFNPNFNLKILDVFTDDEGRQILINFENHKQTYAIVKLNAPTDQAYRKQFYIQSRNWVQHRVFK